MDASQIPKNLVEKYNLFKMDHLKYSTFLIENFENEVNKENSMLNSLKTFLNTLETLYSKISEFISNNKNTFNDTCGDNQIKSLDYLFIIKSTMYLINTVIAKIENKECHDETFQSLYDALNQKFPKIFEVQYPNNDKALLKNVETDTNIVIDYATNIKKATNKPGNILTSLVIHFNLFYTKELNESLQKFESIKEFKDSSFFGNQTQAHEMILFDLLILLRKMKQINTFIYYAYLLDENDLINKKEESAEWQSVKKLLWGVKPKKDIDIDKKCEEILKRNMARMAQMSQMLQEGEVSKLKIVGNIVSNLFGSNQAEYNGKKRLMQLYGFGVQPPNKTMKRNALMKKMMSMRMPSIDFRTKLYLRKEFKPITLEYIKELNDFMNGKISEAKDKSILLFNDENKLPDNIANKKLFHTSLNKNKEEKDFYISTRLMNKFPLIFKGEPNEQNAENKFNNTLIIHINGGGFRSNNTYLMERYQRQWAKDLGVALMTIKKPEKDEDVYPATLSQFYQVYMWLLNHAKDELNMDIKKIILSGDSAGGNLAMSFLNLLIGIKLFEKKDIKIPDLIMLEYPNLSLEVDKIANSYSSSNIQVGFSHAFFKNLVDYYLGEFKDYKNMFVSPLYASDKMVENLPRIRFFFGEKDGSRDDFLRGIYHYRKCKDIRAYDFIGLYHGFNGIDDPDIFEMVEDFIIEEVKDIIKN